ncbi:MAG: major facilitator superfamily 1 [Alphaproteobacteria bacterium]|nr:major facilitator superfamily 1 [Alphaproteobacteria bacterium]
MSPPRIPATVWALGFVSLFMDLSSEIIHSLLPLFLTTGLGASVATVGLIDGIAESTASISKVFSGYFSDRLGRRTPLILLGYGLAVLSKPLFALAGSAGVVLAARFADRIGKGLRGAPRDALIADVTPPEIRGRAFGLRQALDTAGGLFGPLLAVALMFLFSSDMRAVFWVATIPGFASLAIILWSVRDPERPAGAQARPPLRIRDAARFDASFWLVVTIGAVFTLARFSEGFLVLRAHDLGLKLALAPMVLVAMNLVYSGGAYPAGILSDRIQPRILFALGLACLIAADLLLAWGDDLITAFAGISLWGAHMALTQGLLSKLVADRAPDHLRGSAFGIFNLASGIALLAASVVAGLLWVRIGPSATFLAGAGFAGLALVMILISAARKGPRS